MAYAFSSCRTHTSTSQKAAKAHEMAQFCCIGLVRKWIKSSTLYARGDAATPAAQSCARAACFQHQTAASAPLSWPRRTQELFEACSTFTQASTRVLAVPFSQDHFHSRLRTGWSTFLPQDPRVPFH